MRRFSLAFGLALLVSLGGLTPPARLLAQKEFGFDNRKGSGQPYLKPEETVAKFKVADEFEVKLFAGEPQVTNPVAFTIDEKGRALKARTVLYGQFPMKGQNWVNPGQLQHAWGEEVIHFAYEGNKRVVKSRSTLKGA